MCAVNRVQLGDLLDYEQPTRYIVSSTDYDDAYDTPVLTAGQTFILGYTNETEGIYKAGKSNPVIIFDDFVTSFYLVDFDFKVKSSALKILKPKKDVNLYYVYYAMLGINFVPKEHARHWISKYSQFEIAYPSLVKQQEIVSHLDTFTTLISNLESELDMRRKQYENYRNQLLDFEGVEGVEWKTLGEVCDLIRGPFGGALKKEMFVKEGYAIYEQQHAIYGDWIFRYFINDDKFHQMKRFEVKAGDILMSCSGTMGKTSIVPENPIKGIINQALLKLSVKGIAINKFVKAFMDSSWFQKGLSQNTSGGAIQNVASVSILKNLEIPVPPLKAQQEIVEKLDAFENLIQSLEQEIKLRKQQYEYYREKLLTFEKE